MNTSDIQTQAQGKSQILKDKEATELRSQELQTEFQQANAEEYQKGVDSIKRGYQNSMTAIKQLSGRDLPNSVRGSIYEQDVTNAVASRMSQEFKVNETYQEQMNLHNALHEQRKSAYVSQGMQGFNSSSSQADILAKSESMQFVQTAASVSTMTSQGGMAAGSIASGGGTLTSAGHSAIGIQAAERTGSIMAANNLYNNSAAISNILTDAGASQAQIASVLSARNPVERANRMQAVISSHSLRGSVNGRSFNLTTSADGQYSGSFDSSLNVYGGYRVDMGDASAAAGYAAGGVTGMRTVGVINTANNFVQNSFQNVAFYAPGGSVAKLGTNTGFISSNSRYGMGVGKYNQQMATQGMRQEASFGNGVGGGGMNGGTSNATGSMNY